MKAKEKVKVIVGLSIVSLVLNLIGFTIDVTQTTLGIGGYFNIMVCLILSMVIGMGLNILKK